MPVTTFAALIAIVLSAGLVTALAIGKWGAVTVLPILMVIALAARWAMTHVTLDDTPS